jgi:hypothetical protein
MLILTYKEIGMKKNLIAAVIITGSFFATAVIANTVSFYQVENFCTDNLKTPIAKKGFLAFNWSVSCR